MSGDDSARGDRRPVGEALVAALGFEPTTTLAGTGPDGASNPGRGATHQESVTAQTVWVDDPAGTATGDGSNGRGVGESPVSNGETKPAAGPGTKPSSTDGLRPGGRRPARDDRSNGSPGPESTAPHADPVASVDAVGTRSADATVEAARTGTAKSDRRSGGNGPKSQRSKPTTVKPRTPNRSSGSSGSGSNGGGGRSGNKTADKTAQIDRSAEANGRNDAFARRADGEATVVATPAQRPDGPPVSPVGPDAGATAPHHILPDEDHTMRVATPAPAPPTAPAAPTAPPQGPAGYQGPVPPAPPIGRSGSTGGGATSFAGDLAARVPQLMEQGLRRNSKVRARKVRRVVRHVDPWSVLTFSVLFHLCVFASLLLASVLVWNAAEAAGTIENMESFIRELGDYTTYEINGDVVFRSAMIIAGVLTLASSVMVVLLTVVFNLISDLVGGIRVTVVEEETVKVNRHRNQNQ